MRGRSPRCAPVTIRGYSAGAADVSVSLTLVPDDGNLAPCLHHISMPPVLRPTPRCRHQASRKTPLSSARAVTCRTLPTSQIFISEGWTQPQRNWEASWSQSLALSRPFETVPCREPDRPARSFLKLGVHECSSRISARIHGNCGPISDQQINRSSDDRLIPYVRAP